ncbi:MAG: PilZ domain-containing protein [Magnetococcales bacterium]|nr:PilZ domain-containing protein [Magnetococcales bacterium]MBF0155773.1 PilZ domain-containing protein [Magnetococcales bacterium]
MSDDSSSGKAPVGGTGVVHLWWRVLPSAVMEAVVHRYEQSGVLPETRSGLDGEIARALGDADDRHHFPVSEADSPRWELFRSLERKFGHLLGVAHPKPVRLEATRAQLVEGGEIDLYFWVGRTGLKRGDRLELRYCPVPDYPVQLHCYARVKTLRRSPDGQRIRVDCIFETLPEPRGGGAGRGLTRLEPGKSVAPVPSRGGDLPVRGEVSGGEPLAVRVSTAERVVVAPPKAAVAPPVERIVVAPSMAAKVPTVDLPVLPPKEVPDTLKAREAKWEKILAQGKQLAEAVPKADPAKADLVRPMPMEDSGRQDYRVNDLVPMGWKVISEVEFAQVTGQFEATRVFSLRPRVAEQEEVRAALAEFEERLKRRRSRARRLVSWFSEQLMTFFFRSNSGNEEEFFHALTLLLAAVVAELAGQLGENQGEAIQFLSMLKDKLDLIRRRDVQGSRMIREELEKLQESLREVGRGLDKAYEALLQVSPTLAEKMLNFSSALDAIDLTHYDFPKDESLGLVDAMFPFPVNLSATGVAFRTRREGLKRGDPVEVRLSLSVDGKSWETFLCYGRIVFVQGPERDRRTRVACHLSHKSVRAGDVLSMHIARKQREMLAEGKDMGGKGPPDR